MTFSVTRDLGDFEWAGEGLFGVFCQARNLCVPHEENQYQRLKRAVGAFRFNPRMYRMLLDVFRFNLFGLDLVTESRPQREKDAAGGPTSGKTGQSAGMNVDEVDEREISIGEYLEREGYGEGFKEDYLLVSLCSIHAR